jgi:chromate reductase, NAD(P)H dehydrogenase (quinone)
MHIAGISGSLRSGSYNTGLLRAAFEDLPAGVSAEMISLRDLPVYDRDVEEELGFPESVHALRSAVEAADGVLIATPEYNYSVTGALKNAIDWLSRGPFSPIDFKPVAIVGAGGGGGTRMAQQHLREMLQHNSLRVLAGPDVLVARARNHFDGVELVDDGVRARLRQVVDGLVQLAAREFFPPTVRGAVLAVAPDVVTADALARSAAERAYRTITAASVVDATRLIATRSIAAVVLDASLDRGERLVIGAALEQHHPDAPALVADDAAQAGVLLATMTGVQLAGR